MIIDYMLVLVPFLYFSVSVSHLSLPRPFTPDLKLICFTNPFPVVFLVPFGTGLMDLGPVDTGVCLFLVPSFYMFLVVCAGFSQPRSAFQSMFKDDRQRFLQQVSKKQFRTVYHNANTCG